MNVVHTVKWTIYSVISASPLHFLQVGGGGTGLAGDRGGATS